MLIGGGIGVGVIVIGLMFFFISRQSQVSQRPEPLENTPSTTATSPTTDATTQAPLLGHLQYSEAPPDQLQPITGNGQIKLRKAAAKAYQQMELAAQTEGISLMPLSGFRTIADQTELFFEVKAERSQSATQRAKVSAPPHRSEHHTGYAVDLGNANQPETHLQTEFEQTSTFPLAPGKCS